MRQTRLVAALACVLALLLARAPLSAQQTSPTDQQENEEHAMAVLKRAAEFLSRAQRFSVTVNMGYDAVQNWGQGRWSGRWWRREIFSKRSCQ